ncbi:DUF4214 domain-containing protein [Prochlorococcus marinus]|uniref:DUF4214 domain-containing protein n=1 Tax=Prochlorococcus marinus TaxID=1219 RepID=UPI0022B58227|nr:DUF4214 domain-containing protein [Prochlorococcus marinus]
MAVVSTELAKSYFLSDSTSSYRYSIEDTWGYNGYSWTGNANYYIHDITGSYLFKNFGSYRDYSYQGRISTYNIDQDIKNFIVDSFTQLDPLIDLDFTRVFNESDSSIDIYRATIPGYESSAGVAWSLPWLENYSFTKSRWTYKYNSDVTFNLSSNSNRSILANYPSLNSFDAYVILHEIAHALGLSHPTKEGEVEDPYGSWHDSSDTLMSYNFVDTGTATPFFTATDISALQLIYGVESGSAPSDISLSSTIFQENIFANSNVANISTTDPDNLDTHSYSLVLGEDDDDNNLFTITGNNLIINSTPNYEIKNLYKVRISSTDQSNNSFSKAFTLNVSDVNEAPVLVYLSNVRFNENIQADTIISTIYTADVDHLDSHTYKLFNTTLYTDNQYFRIQNNQLYILTTPDYEQKSTYRIAIQSTDSGGLTFDNYINLYVDNIPESPEIDLSTRLFNENLSSNTIISNLTNINQEEVNSTTYSFVSGEGDTDNAMFTIDQSNLKINFIPDFEATPTYSIRVKAVDSNNLSTEKQFVLSVNDLNEAPTEIKLSSSSIDENMAANSILGIISSTDPDASDSHTYSFVSGNGDTDNDLFTISGASLFIKNSPDYEAKSTYSIRLQSEDDGGKTFAQTFSLSVNDLNEAPTEIKLSSSSIDENIAANSILGIISSTDPDASDSHTYSFVSGNGDTDNDLFTISGASLFIKNSPDYEAKSTYSIRLQSEDDGGKTFAQTFSLSVNDLNEAPTEIKLSSLSIDENIPANVTVATLFTSDEDATDSHSYTLVSGSGDTDNSSFLISGNSIKIQTSPDYETKSIYSIRVRTIDSGGKTLEQAFNLLVSDVDEIKPLIFGPANSSGAPTSKTNVFENNAVVHTFNANETVTWSIDQLSSSLFQIDSASGVLTFKQKPDYEIPFTPSGTVVKVETNLSGNPSDLYIELFDQNGSASTLTSTTANNFLAYVNDSSYQNTIIHRSVSNAVLQGGGYTAPISASYAPISILSKGTIFNEPGNSNKIGTIAMAKVPGDPDSATSQWYFNLSDNVSLDSSNGGFTVFGRVLADGFDVLEELSNATIYNASNYYSNSVFSELPLLNYDSTLGVQPDNFLTFKTISLADNYSTIAPNKYNVNVIATDTQGNSSSQYLIVNINDLNEILSTDGNDLSQTTSRNDYIDGLGGTDTVTFSGKFSDYSFTRATNTLEIADQRTTGTTDGTDTLKNIEYIQFSDQTVEESKVDVVKTYSGNYHDYKFYHRGNGKYEIKTDSGYDDITGYPLLRFSGEDTTSALRDVSAIADIKATFDQVTGLTDPSGEMFQLYNAAFKRFPDAEGLKYWINVYSSGINTKKVVAASFVRSAEFKSRYGENVTTEEYVTTLYRNVFDRLPDEDGFNYWVGSLNKEEQTRSDVLMNFAISNENDALFTEMTGLS